MKKYAVIAACLIGASSVLQGFAQTDASSPGASPSGAGTGQPGAQPGKVDAGNPPAGQPSSGVGQDGIINEPSGAQAGKGGVLRTSGGGKVRYKRDDAGVLTLQGNVANEAQKQAIEDKVKTWPGVTSVQNMLEVQGSGINEPSGAERKLHPSTESPSGQPTAPSGPDATQPEQKNP